VEVPATMLWTLGFFAQQNKFSNGGSPVTHRGMWVMLDGHDCGMMIPDVTIPPAPNAAYPFIWPFSARKPVFAASTVQMNGTSVGCAQTFGFIPIPLMTCGDPISAPSAWSMINVGNTLTVGMTWKDIVAGVINILVSVAVDYVFSKIPFAKWFGGEGKLFSNILGTFVGNSFKGMAPGAILAGFLTSSLTGNPTAKATLGLPFLSVTVTYNPNAPPGTPSVVGSYNAGPYSGGTQGATSQTPQGLGKQLGI
jgi:hypothetical protein